MAIVGRVVDPSDAPNLRRGVVSAAALRLPCCRGRASSLS